MTLPPGYLLRAEQVGRAASWLVERDGVEVACGMLSPGTMSEALDRAREVVATLPEPEAREAKIARELRRSWIREARRRLYGDPRTVTGERRCRRAGA